MRSLTRPLVVLGLGLVLTLGLVLGFLRVVMPSGAPERIRPGTPLSEPLARHVLLVIVDGLRYDVATHAGKMPHFAQAMREHASGEIWAGRVSMTSSAVLAFGTGQPGRLEQIVRNVGPDPPPFNSWLENARRQGLRIDVVGDPAWVNMFGSHVDHHLLDPKGVAIDVDFNPQTFRDTRLMLPRGAHFLVSHFVTPDHQAHVHGIFSERYLAHIRDYDAELDALLSGLGPEWTVIVTSDHGAVDSGTHGSDTPIQRRCPIYARGPGIRAGTRLDQPVDQLDLAATLAALLGVPPPAHGRGHLLAEWLDLPEARRAEVACDQAERVARYGNEILPAAEVAHANEALAACRSGAAPAARIADSRRSVRRIDAAITGATGIASPRALALALVTTLGFALMALLALGRRVLRALPWAALLLGVAVALVTLVERLPGGGPNQARAALFVLGLLPVLGLLLFPGRTASQLERLGSLGPVLLPGALLATYTANTQPLSYVAVCIGVVLFCWLGAVHAGTPPLWQGKLRVAPLRFVAIVAVVALGYTAGTKPESPFPRWWIGSESLTLLSAAGALTLWSLSQLGRPEPERSPWPAVMVGLPTLLGSLLLRDHAPPSIGRLGIVGLGLLALAFAVRGSRSLALHLGLASFLWVSRHHEVLVVVGTIAIAEAVSDALRRAHATHSEHGGGVLVMLLITFAFGLLFVQRVGVHRGLDFGGMDWRAGGFGDQHVPAWVVGSALGIKYALGISLAVGALAARLANGLREQLLSGLLVAYLARATALVLMLFIAGGSFWTALRVMGDLPFALLGVVVTTLLWLGARWTASQG